MIPPQLGKPALSKEDLQALVPPPLFCLGYLETCTRPQTVEQISRALSMPRDLVLDCLDILSQESPRLIIERRKKRRRLFLPDKKNIHAFWLAFITSIALEVANELASLSAPFQIHAPASDASSTRVL